MVQQKDPSCPKRFVKTYEELKKDDSIHIMKADKTAALVIMDREDYNRKMTTILSDDTTYERICGDPTEKVNFNINRTIKKSFGNKSDLTNSYIKPCCKLPYMHGVIKTHKENNLTRPIISSVGSCSYFLFKGPFPLRDSLSLTTEKLALLSMTEAV